MGDLRIAVRVERRDPVEATLVISGQNRKMFFVEFYMRILLDDGNLRTTVNTQPIKVELEKDTIVQARSASAAIQEYAQREMNLYPANIAIARFAAIVQSLAKVGKL